MTRALLAGPDPRLGAEDATSHRHRLGSLPELGAELIPVLERSGLRGRGGAGFPAGTKWRAVASRARGLAVVLVNGAEGEPLSSKDRLLMETRPHLVLDGAALAARAVGAAEVVLYVGAAHRRAHLAVERALMERPAADRALTRVVLAPPRYVAGEESAAVHAVDSGVALPTTTPPRPFERGVGGRPTLVQNVETLAHAALVARFGDAWFRSLGPSGGTVLLTLSGVERPGVLEVPHGSPLGEAVTAAGGAGGPASAVLCGGYFGGWIPAATAPTLPLDAAHLHASGHALGCGVLAVLPEGACGLVETARILSHLAGESAGQCGPCVFGLRAIAEASGRLAACATQADDLDRLRRWSGDLPGRGACRHPDGAARLLLSALRTFGDDAWAHHHRRHCLAVAARRALAAPPPGPAAALQGRAA